MRVTLSLSKKNKKHSIVKTVTPVASEARNVLIEVPSAVLTSFAVWFKAWFRIDVIMSG